MTASFFELFTRPARSPFANEDEAYAAMRFGVWLFLIALAALFLASLLGYVIMYVQLNQKGVWPRDLPGAPKLLVLSTGLLAIGSWTIERSARAARRSVTASGADGAPQIARMRLALAASLALAAAFLAVQSVGWMAWYRGIEPLWTGSETHRFALLGFIVLTGLHAAHVLGGVIHMGLCAFTVLRQSRPSGHDAASLRFTALYWHFLGGVWLMLYAMLALTVG